MSCTACASMHMKKRLNRTEARMQPCFISFLMVRAADWSPLQRTCPVIPSWSSWISHKLVWAAVPLPDHPEGLPVDCIKGLCQIYILFNAHLLHLSDDKIMSMVLHPGLKPHCANGRPLSETMISRFRRKRVKIVPAMERSAMPM